ncbi:bromodomain-containing protein 4B-like isoform X1 [Takifugu rubripes]|uniref:bromodomain-containing protein 4B-like isoform X1 n=1 Tax=Takifugu rubripes TaxID=31033 RepID=UPI0011459E6E|nr:bromodomain-containing protein 4B-like isoform X1 [Takifugu rubripes]XP_029683290.1 bromodomain-containing protein 4B-like isoform X1 [Takifugu rubripes]
MDLSTIRERLKNHYYQHGVECVQDFLWVFSNCYRFHQPQADIVSKAKSLEAIFFRMLSKMPFPEREIKTKESTGPSRTPLNEAQLLAPAKKIPQGDQIPIRIRGRQADTVYRKPAVKKAPSAETPIFGKNPKAWETLKVLPSEKKPIPKLETSTLLQKAEEQGRQADDKRPGKRKAHSSSGPTLQNPRTNTSSSCSEPPAKVKKSIPHQNAFPTAVQRTAQKPPAAGCPPQLINPAKKLPLGDQALLWIRGHQANPLSRNPAVKKPPPAATPIVVKHPEAWERLKTLPTEKKPIPKPLPTAVQRTAQKPPAAGCPPQKSTPLQDKSERNRLRREAQEERRRQADLNGFDLNLQARVMEEFERTYFSGETPFYCDLLY